MQYEVELVKNWGLERGTVTQQVAQVYMGEDLEEVYEFVDRDRERERGRTRACQF